MYDLSLLSFFFFLKFKFQDSVCNDYHDLAMLRLNISNIAVEGVDYHYIIHDISKSEAIQFVKKFCIYDCGYI